MLQFMCSDIDIKLNMNMSLHIKDINVFKNSISSEEDIEVTCSFKLQDEETLYSIKLYKVRVQNCNQVYCIQSLSIDVDVICKKCKRV